MSLILSHMDLAPDRALFEGKVQGLVLCCYQNERPPQGLAGAMDWYFRGAISYFVKAGRITGKTGECAYLPVHFKDRIYHLVLTGAGNSSMPGRRNQPPKESLVALRKNLLALRLPQVAVSQSDFGDVEQDFFAEHFKGISVCLTP